MGELSKGEIKRREKQREGVQKFADWFRSHGMEVNIVYAFCGETDTSGIYGKWLEFMSDYCKKHKISNPNLPMLTIGYNGGFGKDLVFKGFELFKNDCDDTGKIYVIDIGYGVSYKDVTAILEIKPAALFAKSCIGQKPYQAYSGTHWDFYNESEKKKIDLYYYAIWNKKKGKVLFADWDMGTSTWYFSI